MEFRDLVGCQHGFDAFHGVLPDLPHSIHEAGSPGRSLTLVFLTKVFNATVLVLKDWANLAYLIGCQVELLLHSAEAVFDIHMPSTPSALSRLKCQCGYQKCNDDKQT